jgi:hypothetical protein
MAPGAPVQMEINGSSSGTFFTELACPATGQCDVAGVGTTPGVGNGPEQVGAQAVFNPVAPGSPAVTAIDSTQIGSPHGFACASSTQCTAVDHLGREVTFNPAAPGTPTPVFIANAPAAASAGPTGTKVKASLGRILVPGGKAATIAAILRAGGFTFALTAPSAGTASIAWSVVPRAKHARPVVVATGRASFAKAGAARITVRLTPSGKQLLRNAKTLTVTSKASFTPTGHAGVSVTKAFALRR